MDSCGLAKLLLFSLSTLSRLRSIGPIGPKGAVNGAGVENMEGSLKPISWHFDEISFSRALPSSLVSAYSVHF